MRRQFITLVLSEEEDSDLLEWYDKHKAEGVNMSALYRNTWRKGIIKDGPPQWFLDWMKDNNGVQPSIGSNVDLGGLFD